MSSESAIRVRDVSKCYPIYEKPHHRLLQSLYRHRRAFYREFWALRNVSFEVARGETVGLVGRNGSGKSTLLQIIAGTMTATSGDAEVKGRVAALLELGSGFNPDFTGRENVYLNATVLGISRQEIDERFDDIAAFADIGEFLDQPLRVYSSGMAVRLAFSVAINVRPEVLIVDEALSVGDEAFQRKCFARIRDFRDRGGTILFVSHAGGTVVELCDRGIVLDAGEKIFEGPPKKAIAYYQRLLYAPPERAASVRAEIQRSAGSTPDRPEVGVPDQAVSGTSEAQGVTADTAEFFDPYLLPKSTVEYVRRGAVIENPRILTPEGDPVNVLAMGRDYVYTYEVRLLEPVVGVRCGIMIKTLGGFELGGLVTHPEGSGMDYAAAGTRLRATFPFRCRLLPGTYFLNSGVVGLVGGAETYLHRVLDLVMFKVAPEAGLARTGVVDFTGVDNPGLQIVGAEGSAHP